MQKQFKKPTIKNLLYIENSKYSCYGIGNSKELSKLNFGRGNCLLLP